ncbi:MAG: hypothetical protein IKU66_06590 [Clostridia bacterium]|nr:hypothetical protein [Clostridia bacterium]
MISQTYTNYENGTVLSSDTARFIYDTWGTLQGFVLNDTSTYLYTKNLQGDILSIVNESGQTILTYECDSWGAVSFSATSMQNLMLAYTLSFVSPFTYRGYCYDYDIELYYLQSRYYSAEIGRFINADSTDYLGITGTVLSFNLFAYCENNPTNKSDAYGNFSVKDLLKVFKQILSNMKKVINFLLEKYGVSTKKWVKMNIYSSPNALYKFVNNNKSTLKNFRNNIKDIALVLNIIITITEVATAVGLDKSVSLGFAEIIFYSLIRLIKFAGGKLIEWIVTTIMKPLVVLKYVIRHILDYLFDRMMSSKYVSRIKSNFISLVHPTKPSLYNYFYALFNGVKLTFA